MAPKKNVPKVMGRPKAVAAPVGVAAVAAPSVEAAGLNAELWLSHSKNLEDVFKHPVFADAASQHPIGINNNEGEASGCQAVFLEAVGLTAMNKTGSFKCGINLAWLDLHFITNPHIPIAKASVETMQERYFMKPNGFAELEVEIGVLQTQLDAGGFGAKGSWMRTSPDEVVIAWFKAVSERIAAGADDAEMLEWLHHLLTTPAVFVRLADANELGWRASKLRENIEANKTLARTAVQKIFDVAQRRIQMGNISAAQMLTVYIAKLGPSGGGGGGEPVTMSFIEKAFHIWDKALRKPEIQTVVLQEESRRELSMFNSVVGMDTLVRKAKTDENIEFIFSAIQDGRRAGLLGPEHMVTRSLEGKIPGSNGKGLVDLLVFKKTMLAHLLLVFVPAKDIPGEIKSKIHDVCVSFGKFRAHMGYKHDAVFPDMGWRAGWPASADALLGMIEDSPKNKIKICNIGGLSLDTDIAQIFHYQYTYIYIYVYL
jgi:hypothetical protein